MNLPFRLGGIARDAVIASNRPRLIDCYLDGLAMSRIGKRNSTLERSLAGARQKNGSPRYIFVLLALGAGLAVPAFAQYPGRVDPNKSAPEPVLRSTAVLEYTGDYTKP